MSNISPTIPLKQGIAQSVQLRITDDANAALDLSAMRGRMHIVDRNGNVLDALESQDRILLTDGESDTPNVTLTWTTAEAANLSWKGQADSELILFAGDDEAIHCIPLRFDLEETQTPTLTPPDA